MAGGRPSSEGAEAPPRLAKLRPARDRAPLAALKCVKLLPPSAALLLTLARETMLPQPCSVKLCKGVAGGQQGGGWCTTGV